MALDQLKERYIPTDNNFYRYYYHYFLYGLMIFIMLLLIGAGVVFYQTLHQPFPVFFAVQPNEQTMSLEPYTEPNLLPDTILRFASKAAVTAYTFDFINYRQEIEHAHPYFTDAGWQDYLRSAQALFDTIVKNQLIVYGVVSGTPVISNQGPLPGSGYTWRVQIPFLVTYETATGPVNRSYYVVITMVRISTAKNPQGIGIDQFVMVDKPSNDSSRCFKGYFRAQCILSPPISFSTIGVWLEPYRYRCTYFYYYFYN